MAKVRKVYICRSCGATQQRWMGKCPDCNTWDSLEESTIDPSSEKDPQRMSALAWTQVQSTADAEPDALAAAPAAGAVALADVDAAPANIERLPTGLREFDRTLGLSTLNDKSIAGLVPGSAVLVGGEPGIGKSTLLLQAARAWASQGTKVLYVSSEESVEQVAMRAKRIAFNDAELTPLNASDTSTRLASGTSSLRHSGTSSSHSGTQALFLLHDTNLARIVEQARKVQPRVLVIDSVQMIYRGDITAAPGSVTQLRRCCAELVYLAKMANIAVVLVGHVTKDGQLAGPRLLEHLVDVVLSFEGDRTHSHRVVRSVKNRFGSTLEIGLFEMTGTGLRELEEGGVIAAIGAHDQPRPGCVLTPVMTGTRCMMVEVQALTATGFLGAAKRKCSGLDANRMAMLIAVLEQHAGLRLADRDIFASSVGGLKVLDPSSDLALLLAIAGAHYRKPIPPRTCALGEVGLSGEVRNVPHLEQRIREAARLGCARVLCPATRDAKALAKQLSIDITQVKNVDQAIEQLG
jgi:DNA repair protein RadA/Sms